MKTTLRRHEFHDTQPFASSFRTPGFWISDSRLSNPGIQNSKCRIPEFRNFDFSEFKDCGFPESWISGIPEVVKFLCQTLNNSMG